MGGKEELEDCLKEVGEGVDIPPTNKQNLPSNSPKRQNPIKHKQQTRRWTTSNPKQPKTQTKTNYRFIINVEGQGDAKTENQAAQSRQNF